MTTGEELLREVQMQTAILRAAHRDALAGLSTSLREDKTSDAIMEVLRGSSAPLSVTAILERAPDDATLARRTVQTRLGQLEEMGVVRRLGAGASTTYELTGLLS